MAARDLEKRPIDAKGGKSQVWGQRIEAIYPDAAAESEIIRAVNRCIYLRKGR